MLSENSAYKTKKRFYAKANRGRFRRDNKGRTETAEVISSGMYFLLQSEIEQIKELMDEIESRFKDP